MPLEQCKKGGVSGWRWGSSGACYPGPNGKKLALKQGVAIEGPDKFKQEVTKAAASEHYDDMAAALREYEQENPPSTYTDDLVGTVAAVLEDSEETRAYVSKKERDAMPKEDFGDPDNERYPVKDEKHFKLAWDLSGRESPESKKRIRERLLKIAKRKGYKIPESAK